MVSGCKSYFQKRVLPSVLMLDLWMGNVNYSLTYIDIVNIKIRYKVTFILNDKNNRY
jgi:hypothetical protein